MPTYRSITIALHSQFDVETLPEYWPDPNSDPVSGGLAGSVPKLIDDTTSTCSVCIPTLPGSNFWISYVISPPVHEDQYFFFKLYINGAHIVSWGVGKDERWRGKTMFGLFERPEDESGKRRVEKRVLCFSPLDKEGTMGVGIDTFDDKACIEIKIHRADAKKRIERRMEEYRKTQHGVAESGINLVNAGHAGAEVPKRFYKFALIDPVDQPFVTFRYYYRTWDQLRDQGLLEAHWNVAEENELSIIEPQEIEPQEMESQETKLQESEPISPTSYQPHPAYPDSPKKSAKGTGTALALIRAISSTWKRRGTQKGAEAIEL